MRHYLLIAALALFQPVATLLAHPGDEAALGHLDRQLQQQPTAENYLQRASIYLRHGDLKQAEQDIAAAATLGNTLQVTLLHSELLTLQHQPNAAIKQLDGLLQAYPEIPEALQQRARLLVSVGREQEAAHDYHRLLQAIDAQGPGLYLEAANVFAKAEGIELAVAALDAGIKQLGMTVSLQRPAVDYCLQAGLYQSAIERQLQLRQVMAESPLWQLQMAEVYWQAGEIRSAHELLHELDVIAQQRRQSPGLRAILDRAYKLKEQMLSVQS